MDEPIRVVLVDDHELVRVGLRGILDADPGISVVAEAASGDQALAAAAVHQPDVVIMDLHMPGMGGVEATRRLTATHPSIAVLVVTMFDDDDSVIAAMQGGARGYLLKGVGREDIRAAVRTAHLGHITFGPGVADRMLDRALRAPPSPSPLPSLTPREHEILTEMVDGYRPADIGRHMGVTEKTIRNNISSILAKLQVADRAAAIELATRAGIGRRPPDGQLS